MARNSRPRPEGYDPLALAPEKAKPRYAKTAERSHTQPMAAIKLTCLDCCGWEYTEAKRCEVKSCPMWAFNRRIFKG